MENLTIGTRIAELRKKVGLTQSQLADRLMISNKAVSKWESNNGAPCLEMLIKLSQTLNCSLDYLVLGDFGNNKLIEEILIEFGTKNDYYFVADLRTLIHCLICGDADSGKSNLLHCIIKQLLNNFNHDNLKLALINTTTTEFDCYKNKPHIYKSVANTTQQAYSLLNELVNVLDSRYAILSSCSCQNIVDYNRKYSESKLPFIIVIIDELTDELLNKENSCENFLIRLTQLGRAAGIHLIATSGSSQKHILSTDLKNNFPTLIASKMKRIDDYRSFFGIYFDDTLEQCGDMFINYYNDRIIRKFTCPHISLGNTNNN